MKSFRKLNKYTNDYWARFMRDARKYNKNFWKKSCPYTTRWRMCARAAWRMERDKILTIRYAIRNLYGKKVNSWEYYKGINKS